jgi:ADP-ribose pyrophosphatase
VLLELPAGTLNPGEDPETTARRELREEAGHSAQRLFRLGGFWATSGWCDEFAHVFLATGLRPDPLPQDDVEDIHVVETPLDRVPDLIRSGEITDQFAVAALLTALYLYPNQLPAMAGRR